MNKPFIEIYQYPKINIEAYEPSPWHHHHNPKSLSAIDNWLTSRDFPLNNKSQKLPKVKSKKGKLCAQEPPRGIHAPLRRVRVRPVHNTERPCMPTPSYSLTHTTPSLSPPFVHISHFLRSLSLSLSLLSLNQFSTFSHFSLQINSQSVFFFSPTNEDSFSSTISIRCLLVCLRLIDQWRFLRRWPHLRRLFTSATSTPTSPTDSCRRHSRSSRASPPFAFAGTPPPAGHSVMATLTSFLHKTV